MQGINSHSSLMRKAVTTWTFGRANSYIEVPQQRLHLHLRRGIDAHATTRHNFLHLNEALRVKQKLNE